MNQVFVGSAFEAVLAAAVERPPSNEDSRRDRLLYSSQAKLRYWPGRWLFRTGVGASSSDCRSGELRGVNRDVRLHVAQLELRSPVQPRDGPAKRHPDAGDLAIIRVVNLRDKAADRRPGKAYQPHEQTRLRVEA